MGKETCSSELHYKGADLEVFVVPIYGVLEDLRDAPTPLLLVQEDLEVSARDQNLGKQPKIY